MAARLPRVELKATTPTSFLRTKSEDPFQPILNDTINVTCGKIMCRTFGWMVTEDSIITYLYPSRFRRLRGMFVEFLRCGIFRALTCVLFPVSTNYMYDGCGAGMDFKTSTSLPFLLTPPLSIHTRTKRYAIRMFPMSLLCCRVTCTRWPWGWHGL